MSRRVATVAISGALAMSLALPAIAGGWINCVAVDGVKTWGYTGTWQTYAHNINGWVTFRDGITTQVFHPKPPSVNGNNQWDVGNVIGESANCWTAAP